MPDRRSHWDSLPELPDSAVTLWHDDATRYPEAPPPSKPPTLNHGNIPRWAPALSQHPAPWVSRDGRGLSE